MSVLSFTLAICFVFHIFSPTGKASSTLLIGVGVCNTSSAFPAILCVAVGHSGTGIVLGVLSGISVTPFIFSNACFALSFFIATFVIPIAFSSSSVAFSIASCKVFTLLRGRLGQEFIGGIFVPCGVITHSAILNGNAFC